MRAPENGPLVRPERQPDRYGQKSSLPLDLQNLDATEEERARAKAEVMKLLRQRTNFDASGLVDTATERTLEVDAV